MGFTPIGIYLLFIHTLIEEGTENSLQLGHVYISEVYYKVHNFMGGGTWDTDKLERDE